MTKQFELLKPVTLRQRKVKWVCLCSTADSIVATVQRENVHQLVIGDRYFEPITTSRRNWSGIAIHGSALYVAVKHGDIYRKLNKHSKFQAMKGKFRPWTCLTAVGYEMFAGVEEGPIYKYDRNDDTFKPMKVARQDWQSLAICRETLYGLTATGQLYEVCKAAWFPTTGCHIKLINTSYVTLNTITAITSDGYRLYLVDNQGVVYCWPSPENKIVKIAELSCESRTIAFLNNNLYLGGFPGDVYKIEVSDITYNHVQL